VNSFVIGLLCALAATNQPVAVSNVTAHKTGVAVALPDSNDPLEKEYQKILDDDDTAQAEVDKWILENHAFDEKGGGVSSAALNQRIKTRFEPIRKAYEEFLQRHPDHARARLAYGSFLNDTRDEDGAEAQWEKARQLDPNNPAAWNNLANYYSEHGPVKKSFEYYAKAIELNPGEALYYHNLADLVYLFRKDSMAIYGLTEQEVFTKALGLYTQAIKLDPDNFPLATDVAQTFYGIKPTRTEEALKAWNYALKIAHDEIEREGVYVHLARFKLHAGRFEEARRQLTAVTNEMYMVLKDRLIKNLNEQEAQAGKTNAPPAAVGKK
jgi:tetratricopeptide (TPR) repeat protein